jgi:sodium/proline symporter
MYEIVPGFVANFIAIAIVNRVVTQQDPAVIASFDQVQASLSSR